MSGEKTDKKSRNDNLLEAKIGNLCCHFRSQITPFPEHFPPKMSLIGWELWILFGLQITHKKS